jgi:hemerythrin
MILLSWQDDYRVGVPLIDQEHRYLFALINEFHDKHASGDPHRQVILVLNRLVAYAEQHFQHEEALMKEYGYPRLAHQHELHEELYSSIFALNERLSSETARVDADTLRFLRHWLLGHILKEDMDIGDFMRRKSIQAQKAEIAQEAGQQAETAKEGVQDKA